MCSYFHTEICYFITFRKEGVYLVSMLYLCPLESPVLQTECCSAPCGCPPAPTRPPRRSTRSRRPGQPSVSTSLPPGKNILHKNIFCGTNLYKPTTVELIVISMWYSISVPLPLMVWKTYRRTLRSPFNRKLFLSSPNLPKRSTTESPPPRPNEVLLMEF